MLYLYEFDDPASARTELDRAVELRPSDPSSRLARAWTSVRLGRFDDVGADLGWGLVDLLGPDRPRLQVELDLKAREFRIGFESHWKNLAPDRKADPELRRASGDHGR